MKEIRILDALIKKQTQVGGVNPLPPPPDQTVEPIDESQANMDAMELFFANKAGADFDQNAYIMSLPKDEQDGLIRSLLKFAKFREDGEAALDKKDYKTAVTLLTKAINSFTNCYNFRLFSKRAIALYNLYRFDESIADAEKCMKITPESTVGYYLKFHVLWISHRMTEATTFMHQCESKPKVKEVIDQYLYEHELK